jgi:amino acid transporter
MANYRVLPEFLGTVSRRYATPVASSVIVGLLIVILSAVYYLVTSVQSAFFDVIDVTGLLFSIFYILTALAAVAYYRRRIVSGVVDFVTVGLLPLGAAGVRPRRPLRPARCSTELDYPGMERGPRPGQVSANDP